MPRRSARPAPERTLELATPPGICPACGRPLWAANKPQRTVVTLEGLVRLRLQVRSCRNPECPRHGICLRPEQEGRFALPQHEFGLDVIALVGVLRHAEHRSVPEIHAELVRRGVAICARSVTNLLDRYDELLALACSDAGRLEAVTAAAGRVILAIDGLQPDVGHEVLWVIRDVLSGEVLLARSLLSLDPGRPGQAPRRGQGGVVGADRRGRLRRPDLDPQGGRQGAGRCAASALPFPLPPRGGHAGLRGRPPRQGPAQEEGPGHPADRAEGRGEAATARPNRSGATARRSARR